jgi:hypothetical protein
MESALDDGSETFIHELLESPYKQIRLLRFVQAGPTDADNVSIQFSTLTDGEAPEYKAISYTWGDETDIRTIQISGKCFTVRRNCHYALWQTWLHYPNDCVWIDSICINQADVGETSVQVQKMSQIYENAHTVLLCVGPHQDRSDRLKDYAGDLKRILESYDGKNDLDFYGRAWTALRGESYAYKAVETIRAFMTRPYWSRLWIVQEVTLARSRAVLCGDDVLDWSLIEFLMIRVLRKICV